MSMQGQARLSAAVGTLESVGAPVETTWPAVRMSDGLDTASIRHGMGIEHARFGGIGGLSRGAGSLGRGMGSAGRGTGALGGGTKFSAASDLLNIIGAASSIASFLQGIGGDKPQKAIDEGGKEQRQHESEVAKSKQCASNALNVIDQAHDQCAAAAESVVDKVLSFLKMGLIAGGHPAIANIVVTVLKGAAKFIETLVMGRNMTVTGCMQNLCQDMQKPALPGNSGKAVCHGGEETPSHSTSTPTCERPEAKPSVTEQAEKDCGVPKESTAPAPKAAVPPVQHVSPAECMPAPNQQANPPECGLPPVQQTVTVQQAVVTECPAPSATPSSPSPECTPQVQEVKPAGTPPLPVERVQPPAVPPQQVPGMICGQPGLGSVQWHGFLKLVVELLCPPADGTSVPEPPGHTQPAPAEPPRPSSAETPPAPSSQTQSCEQHPVETKEPAPCTASHSEPAKPEVPEKCEATRPEVPEKCEPAKQEVTEKCEPVKQEATERCEPAKQETTERCEPAKPEATERCEREPHPCEDDKNTSRDEKSEEKSKSKEPAPPLSNDKAPSDGYHGFDKSQHPSFPGNGGQADPAPHLSGGVVGDGQSPVPGTPSAVGPAEMSPPAKESPVPQEPTSESPRQKPAPAGPSPAPRAPELSNLQGSWSPDIWVGAGVSAEVQTAGRGISLELAGAAAFGVEIERSGAW